MDRTLSEAFLSIFSSKSNICLIAVGGYGRRELHPYSDIDILILVSPETRSQHEYEITEFINCLWDLKIEIGHSVRTISECINEATRDITIHTNILESRLIIGDSLFFNEFSEQCHHFFTEHQLSFYRQKYQEQVQRYEKYNNTAYCLEPDIKYSPGGLRDNQTISWIAKHFFGAEKFVHLIREKFITEDEYQALKQAQNFLWKIRFALHVLAKRKEDRLLFDHQLALAKEFGFRDSDKNLAIEQFMKQYFRAIKALMALNEMLMQFLEESILEDEHSEVKVINHNFTIKNGLIGVNDSQLFAKHPSRMLELFVLMGKHQTIHGIQAQTIRLLHQNKHLIDEKFKQVKQHRKLFLTIFDEEYNLPLRLQLMNRYDILGQYIPEFDHAVGQMQYDLFHIYTVDQHTLFVLRNLYQFAYKPDKSKFPLCTKIINDIDNKTLLYLSALFHDIGKGRGGDHSKIGAEFVDSFSLMHGFTKPERKLLRWLVKHHLLMSSTAQRQDIHDPEVIQKFANLVKNEHYLKYLYLLTCADISATNEELWTSWKNSLLNQLYQATSAYLAHKREKSVTRAVIVDAKKTAALSLINTEDIAFESVKQLWRHYDDDYFLRETEHSIAWHTKAIVEHNQPETSLVLIRSLPAVGATEIFIYTRDQQNLFATTTAILDRCQLNVVEARIITTQNGYSLDSYMVLDEHNTPIIDQDRLEHIRDLLGLYHSKPHAIPHYQQRKIPLSLQHFVSNTQMQFKTDSQKHKTILSIISTDRPGLLARLGRAFVDCEIQLHNAKINTLGDRVEDVFLLTNNQGEPLDRKQQYQLRKRIHHYL